MDIEFIEIDWDKKTELLAKGEIDLIWNGMKRTDELESSITCSNPYLSNAQVIVMRQKDGFSEVAFLYSRVIIRE